MRAHGDAPIRCRGARDRARAGSVGLALLLLASPARAQDATLEVEILDEATGQKTPVRVSLETADGAPAPLPEQAIAIQYGRDDSAEGYGRQPDGSFYVDGSFGVSLSPGRYRLRLSKGNEYLAQDHWIDLGAGERASPVYRLRRWIDMPARGWYSADDHIHIRRSPRENPLILDWVAAEDVHVGALLQMGDFWTSYYPQYAWGQDGVYQVRGHLLTSGQEEPRTHSLGHTISLGADGFVRFAGEYYHYDRVFDRVRELGGLTGYAHQATSYYFRGYRGMTLDVLRGKVDFLEVLQFCSGFTAGPLRTRRYYHFLDLGFELTATAGSDFPWCGPGPGWNARIGNARFYTKVEGPLSFEGWKAGLAAGRTFVSSGPILELEVDGRLPGDRLDVPSGSRLAVTARAFGHPEQVPLEELELVVHGEALQRALPAEPGQSTAELAIELELPVARGLWIAARCRAGEGQLAHTTPVYVTVEGSGFENPDTAWHYLDLNERYLQELERDIDHPADRADHRQAHYREGLAERIAETRGVIDGLRRRIPPPPGPAPALGALPALMDGWRLATQGEIPGAIAAYAEAVSLDPDLVPSVEAQTTLCLYGSLWGHAADVMDACDSAVALAPWDAAARRNRGIARALAGDPAGALSDLEEYDPRWVGERDRAQRDAWSAALRRGESPFTADVLEAMRSR